MSLDKPRFRRDLEAVPLEADGQRYVEVMDPVTGGTFRLYDSEYHVALAFDGLAFDKVKPWLKLALGLDVDESVLREFAAHLHELGFLEPDQEVAPGPSPAVVVEAARPRPEVVSRKAETSEPGLAISAQAIGVSVWRPEPREQEVVRPAVEAAGQAQTAEEAEPATEEAPAAPLPAPVQAAEEATLAPAEAPEVAGPPPIAAGEEAVLAPVETPQEAVPAPVETPQEVVPAPVETSQEAVPAPVETPQEAVPAPVEVAAETPPREGPAAPEVVEPPPIPVEARRPDSTAFPVLPPSPARVVESPSPAPAAPPARPAPPSVVTPTPVRPPPLPFMTPPPITLPPLPAAQQAALRKRQRRSLVVFGSLGVLTAAAVLAIALPFFFPTRDSPRADVRATVAAPGTLFRYFAGAGAVTALPGPVLKFPAPGKVTRIAKAGSVVAAGDVVAAVEAARPLQNQLAHQRERLAFYQQMAEAMHQVGNTAEEDRQLANVEVRKARVAKALRALSSVAVVADSAGEVEEAFTAEGDGVEAGSLALRLRSTALRATFDLPRAQAAEARRLGFCQLGVDAYVVDCTPAQERNQERNDDARVVVDIASLPAALLGRPAHLARARFEGAVALPVTAILTAGRRRQVLVVSPGGRVEARPVTVAEENASEAIVIQGLDAGENVILAPAPNLRPGARVSIRP